MAFARIKDEQTKNTAYINTNNIVFLEQGGDGVDIHMNDRTLFVVKGNLKEIVENIRLLEVVSSYTK